MKTEREKNVSKIRLYFLMAAVLISFPVLSEFYVGYTGKVLVASPNINHDKNFAKTVIYIFDHSLWGARGIIINQPIKNKNDFFKDDTSYPAFKGGPVFFPDLRLAAIEEKRAAGRWRTQDLFVFQYNFIDEVLGKKQQAERDDIRIYIGVSGWGFGQLENEVKIGGWNVVDFDRAYLNTPNLWEQLAGQDNATE